ncbi:AmmeMemoRadiSam system radical SAM enzyme, partial [bacterium]|nr:AmmeMemoRadiSam system radical SAM enzyme [bacterium]
PHACRIADGKRGRCGVRSNRAGTLCADTYGQVTSVAMDPIEKKPLYHFHPGTRILSLGTRGCNFACSFCQNWTIAQAEASTSPLAADEAVAMALREGSVGIAYTYNEPLVGYECVLETAQLARAAGLANVLVTNGFIQPEPLAELLPWIDAMNLDIKSIRPEFYRSLCGGRLEPVLRNAKAAAVHTHLEVTNLIIPGHNDTDEELAALAAWVAEELGPHTPVHLSAYSPRHRLKAPPTPVTTLERAYGIFSPRLHHVYLGNVQGRVGASTRCHQCGTELIRRRAYRIEVVALDGARCAQCGGENNIVRARDPSSRPDP